MNSSASAVTANQGFDLIRLSKSKSVVDLVPNTIRAYHENGLPLYRMGKVVFFSKTELDSFIRNPEAFKALTKKR